MSDEKPKDDKELESEAIIPYSITDPVLRRKAIDSAKASLTLLRQVCGTMEKAAAYWMAIGIDLLLAGQITAEQIKACLEVNFTAVSELHLAVLLNRAAAGDCLLCAGVVAVGAGNAKSKAKPMNVFDENDPGPTPKGVKVN